MPVNYENIITNTKLLFLLLITPDKVGEFITLYFQHLKTYALTNEHTNKHTSHVKLITFDVHSLFSFIFHLQLIGLFTLCRFVQQIVCSSITELCKT
jgi:hypothetical protein